MNRQWQLLHCFISHYSFKILKSAIICCSFSYFSKVKRLVVSQTVKSYKYYIGINILYNISIKINAINQITYNITAITSFHFYRRNVRLKLKLPNSRANLTKIMNDNFFFLNKIYVYIIYLCVYIFYFYFIYIIWYIFLFLFILNAAY